MTEDALCKVHAFCRDGEEITEMHLIYLDELRESGVTNMYGAGPFVESEFGVERKVAGQILAYWMETFSERREAMVPEPGPGYLNPEDEDDAP